MILIVFAALVIIFSLFITLFTKSNDEDRVKQEKLSKEGLKEIQKHRKG